MTTSPPPAQGDPRTRAVLAGYAGDRDAARGLLADDDPSVRASALGALDRMGQIDSTDLRAGLADDDSLVRRRAASICAHRNELPVESLAALLDDADDRVVEVVAFACGERPDSTEAVVERLGRIAIDHADSLCRESAVAALGSLGRAESLPIILTACTDRATVRRRAVLALAAFDDPAATEMLRTMIADRDLQVRQAAEELLAIDEGGEW